MLGDRQSYCVVLVVPNFPNLEAWARESGIDVPDRKALLASNAVHEHMEARVMACLEDLAGYERPKKVGLIADPFTVDDGTLTPSQKVRRGAVEARNRKLIEAFYRKENFDQTVFVEARSRPRMSFPPLARRRTSQASSPSSRGGTGSRWTRTEHPPRRKAFLRAATP